MCSLTSQGHPYAIFRRALERRNSIGRLEELVDALEQSPLIDRGCLHAGSFPAGLDQDGRARVTANDPNTA